MKKINLLLASLSLFALVACNQQETPHVHTYSEEWFYNENDHFHRATCEHAELVSDKAPHTYGEWVIDQASTTYHTGKKHANCTVCGYRKEETIPLHVHTAGDPVMTDLVDSTCTEDGHYYTSTYCTECGQRMSGPTYVKIDRTGHRYGDPVYTWYNYDPQHPEYNYETINGYIKAERPCLDCEYVKVVYATTTFSVLSVPTSSSNGRIRISAILSDVFTSQSKEYDVTLEEYHSHFFHFSLNEDENSYTISNEYDTLIRDGVYCRYEEVFQFPGYYQNKPITKINCPEWGKIISSANEHETDIHELNFYDHVEEVIISGRSCSGIKTVVLPENCYHFKHSLQLRPYDLSKLDFTFNMNEYHNGYYFGSRTNPYFYYLGHSCSQYSDTLLPCYVNEIHTNCKIIDGYFYWMPSETSVTFPEGLRSYQKSFPATYETGETLVEVNMPSTLRYFNMSGSKDDQHYYNCFSYYGSDSQTRIQTVNFDSNNPYFKVTSEGVLMDRNNTRVFFANKNSSSNSFTTPDTVKVIDRFALKGRSWLETLNLNDNVHLSYGAFENCSNLTTLTFGRVHFEGFNNTQTNRSPFYNCPLSSITFNGTLLELNALNYNWPAIFKHATNKVIHCSDGNYNFQSL